MSSDADTPRPEPSPTITYSYGYDSRLYAVHEVVGNEGSIYRQSALGPEPRKPPFQFVHDKDKGLFILPWPDGRVERFRDRPARQLMVEPDPETGEMRPVLRYGQPVYVYHCREEREIA